MAKIMLIDDEVDITDSMKLLLEGVGHEVATYNDTDGAVEQLSKFKPDLLLLDVMFPEQPSGGFDLARLIRKTEALKNLPIILLTGINQEMPLDFSADDIDSAWMPVQEFLEKPVDIKMLEKKIAELTGAK